jgi:hypothetical protein
MIAPLTHGAIAFCQASVAVARPMAAAAVGLWLGLSFAAGGGAADAKTIGLLVGASDYLHLGPDKTLLAPRTDVRRMRAALAQRGAAGADIEILADGVAGALGPPTEANLRAAFTRLIARTSAGDHVVLYLSGHGTRVPDDDGDETDDSMDEAFVPLDAQPIQRNGRADMLRVIRDDDFARLFTALRAKGAHVWFIVDSCHSGSMSRSFATDPPRERSVQLKDTPPVQVLSRSGTPPPPFRVASATPDLPGSLVSFYAAQATEAALEVTLKTGARGQERTHVGVFTHALVRALEAGEATSYRQLLTLASRFMRAERASPQTPTADGDTAAMDAPILGRGTVENGGLAVEGGTISGGRLAGLEPGTVVALFERPGGPAIGHGEIIEARDLVAGWRPIALDRCRQDLGLADCPTAQDANGLLARARHARILRAAPAQRLRLAGPVDWPGLAIAPSPVRAAAEARFLERIAEGHNDRLVRDEATPATRLHRTPDGYRLLLAHDGATAEPFGPRVALADDPERLARDLEAAALRAQTLLRIASLIRPGAPASGLRLGPAMTVTLGSHPRRVEGETIACDFASPATPKPRPAGAQDLTRAGACDAVDVRVDLGSVGRVVPYLFAINDDWSLQSVDGACGPGGRRPEAIGNRWQAPATRYPPLGDHPDPLRPAGRDPIGHGPTDGRINGVLAVLIPEGSGPAASIDGCDLYRAINRPLEPGSRSLDDGTTALARAFDPPTTRGLTGAGLMVRIERWGLAPVGVAPLTAPPAARP